jgi:dTDP-3-amino-2,3,6-trideoxy-4-keto-D-glucose/dTDP-3-amino-3,4,6-trideoxy-alpha-D-glucose/dTDP-2,6-dideoxy-D-kanosamine transaminase
LSYVKNFLPEQYKTTGDLAINHNYLKQQFADYGVIFEKIQDVIIRGDYTLGEAVDQFEHQFSMLVGAKHAIGVGSGTDALFLSLKALGVGEGDEVITTPFTFYATIGAIVTAGAKPVFVDISSDYNIDPSQIEKAITPKTKAILPVHWAGKPCHMDEILTISQKHGIPVVEDACHAIKATYKSQYAGTFGKLGCFSFHPLKNLNVWGDGGIIVTDSDALANELKLIRNHGLKGRDECLQFSYNSRLDTIQAVVASHLLEKIDCITESRISNAQYLDEKLAGIDGIIIPERDENIKQVYHLYSACFLQRDELQKYLTEKQIDAKVHYPVPMHLQPAAKYLNYNLGDFPMSEKVSASTLSLPVHEFISRTDLDHIADTIKGFYS